MIRNHYAYECSRYQVCNNKFSLDTTCDDVLFNYKVKKTSPGGVVLKSGCTHQDGIIRAVRVLPRRTRCPFTWGRRHDRNPNPREKDWLGRPFEIGLRWYFGELIFRNYQWLLLTHPFESLNNSILMFHNKNIETTFELLWYISEQYYVFSIKPFSTEYILSITLQPRTNNLSVENIHFFPAARPKFANVTSKCEMGLTIGIYQRQYKEYPWLL